MRPFTRAMGIAVGLAFMASSTTIALADDSPNQTPSILALSVSPAPYAAPPTVRVTLNVGLNGGPATVRVEADADPGTPATVTAELGANLGAPAVVTAPVHANLAAEWRLNATEGLGQVAVHAPGPEVAGVATTQAPEPGPE